MKPKRGLIPAAPVARVISEWVQAQEEKFAKLEGVVPIVAPLVRLAKSTGTDPSNLRKIKDKEWIGFDRADKIVCAIDPLLWLSDDELSGIYQSFDLAFLDEKRPTTRLVA